MVVVVVEEVVVDCVEVVVVVEEVVDDCVVVVVVVVVVVSVGGGPELPARISTATTAQSTVPSKVPLTAVVVGFEIVRSDSASDAIDDPEAPCLASIRS
jgi:hypothetical protein